MSVLDQIKKSQLSKQGKTNPTGQFEGTPANVATVIQSQDYIPRATTAIPAIQNPIDATYNNGPQPTYLDYIRSSKKI